MTLEQPNSSILTRTLQSSPLAGIANIGWQSDYAPIIKSLPAATQAFQNKYGPSGSAASLVSAIPTPYRNSLIALDQQRMNRGQNPLSEKQTINVLKTAIQGKPATPEPKHSFFGNVVRDLKTLGSSVPHIPSALVHEALAIPELPAYLAQHPNPVDILQAPGIRLFPGTYTAHGILSGHPEQVFEHPVFTALDVLPVAKQTGATAALARKAAPLTEALSKTKLGRVTGEIFGKDQRLASEMAGRQALKLESDIWTDAPPTFPEEAAWTANTRAAGKILKESKDKYKLAESEKRAVIEAFESGDTSTLTNPNQLALFSELKPINDEFTRIRTNEKIIQAVDINGTPELYHRSEASRILRHRRVSENANLMGRVREFVDPNNQSAILNPQLATSELSSLYSRADPTVPTPSRTTSLEQARLAERGYITALRHQGYDTSFYDRINRRAKLDKTSEATRRSYVLDEISRLDPSLARPVRTVPELLQTLDERAKLGDNKVKNIQEAIRSKNYVRARQLSREVSKRTLAAIPDIEQIVDELGSHRTVSDFITKTKEFNPRSVAARIRKANQVERETVPARFVPMVKNLVNEKIKEAYSTHPDFDKLMPLIAERNYELLPDFGGNNLASMTDEIKATWQTLRDELPPDQQPIFIHQVPSGREGQIHARPLEHVTTESAIKQRTFDNTPYIRDAAVAMTHQGVEKLRRIHSEALAKQFIETFGGKPVDLMEKYLPEARRLAARSGEDPRIMLDRLLKRDYTIYDPETIFTFSTPALKAYQAEGILIPKTIANVLQKMHTPPGGRISEIFDPIMRTFRTSVLPLSPRWHVNNVLSGMIVLSAESGPEVLTYFGRAKQAMRDGTIPIETGVGSGAGSIPRELALSDYQRGKFMRAQLEESAVGRATSGLREGFGKVVQRSYHWNELVDDLYRSMAYLYGHDKAYAKLIKQGDIEPGLAKAQAQQAGIELAKKVMPNWLNMTPIERSIIRQVFPFYGWVRHILKYTMHYPVDHPTRTAIVGSLARAEFEDRNALPDKFLDYLFLGGMNEAGEVKALNTKALNPFSDVSRYFTLAGFLGSTNPVISTVLRSAGFNPATGGPDLFPATRYDSTSGRLAASVGNPLTNLVQSTIPQSRLLFDVFGQNSDFKSQLRSDPNAAINRLQSYAGLPNIYNKVNVPQEQYKAELAREDAQNNALNNALRSGSDSPAANYPGLTPLLSQVRSLQASDLLTAYQPAAGQPGLLDIARQTLIRSTSGT